MKIYISLDMEGIAGTYSWKQEDSNRAEVRKCMAQQIQWVLEGIEASKLNEKVAEIVVADSHSEGDNLTYDITELDNRLHLISGYPRPKYMMPAFDSSYSVAFFVGYHGGIGTLHSVMDHSYSPRFHKIWVNDKPVNESLLNAAYAGCFNVPVGLVIGDDALQMQLSQTMPWIKYVVTKYSLSRFAVKSRPFYAVKKETIDAVKEVLSVDTKKIPVYEFSKPVKLKIELVSTSMADAVEMIPDVKRIDGFTIELVHNDYAEVFDAIDAIAGLADTVKW